MNAIERQKRIKRLDDRIAGWVMAGIMALAIVAALTAPAPSNDGASPREAFRVGIQTESAGDEWLDCQYDGDLDAYYCRRDNP